MRVSRKKIIFYLIVILFGVVNALPVKFMKLKTIYDKQKKSLKYPVSIYVDKYSSTFISDWKARKIYRVLELNGNYEFKIIKDNLPKPIYITGLDDNNLILSLQKKDKVAILSYDGKNYEKLNINGLIEPRGIAVNDKYIAIAGNKSGKVFLLDKVSKKILKIFRNPKNIKADPRGVAFFNNSLLVTYSNRAEVVIFDLNSSKTKVIKLPYGTEKGKWRMPRYIQTDVLGAIYVTDYLSGKVVRIDTNGKVDDVITGLNRPEGLIVTKDAKIYVVEAEGKKIKIYDCEPYYKQLCWGKIYLDNGMVGDAIVALKDAYKLATDNKVKEQLSNNLSQLIITLMKKLKKGKAGYEVALDLVKFLKQINANDKILKEANEILNKLNPQVEKLKPQKEKQIISQVAKQVIKEAVKATKEVKIAKNNIQEKNDLKNKKIVKSNTEKTDTATKSSKGWIVWLTGIILVIIFVIMLFYQFTKEEADED